MKISPILSQAFLVQLLVSCSTDVSLLSTLKDPVAYSGAMAGSLHEGTRTVKGQLKIEPTEFSSYINAIITTPPGETIEASWPQWSKAPKFIDPAKTYDIELLTRIYVDPNYEFNDVLRVSEGGKVLIDSSICHLHHLPMTRRIEDGRSRESYPPYIDQVHRIYFPHDGNVYLGCGSGISHPPWRCKKCYKEFEIWAKRNGIEETF
jgi:hypothetical protein